MGRRSFLQNVGAAVAASPTLSTGLTLVGAGGALLLPIRLYSVQDFETKRPLDKVDANKRYIENTDMSDWHAEAHPVLRNVVPKLLSASHGAVVGLGSFKGESLKVLKSVFPMSKVISVDIERYHDDPNLVVADIRANPLRDQPVKIGWNDISNWHNSPRSRHAAFDYLKRNLVRGGLYIDDAFGSLPHDLDLSGFELVYAKGHMSIFKKI